MQRSTLFIFGILGVLLFCNLFYTVQREGKENMSKACKGEKMLRSTIDRLKRMKDTPGKGKMIQKYSTKLWFYNVKCKKEKEKKKKEEEKKKKWMAEYAKKKNAEVKKKIASSKKELVESKEADKKDFIEKSDSLKQMREARQEQSNFDLGNKMIQGGPRAMKGMPNIGGDNKDVLFKLSFNDTDKNDDGAIDKAEFKGILENFAVREGFADGDKNWKVTIDKGGDLVFNHKGKTVTKITKQGEIVSKKCKCGMWNLRDSRIGIPGRNDMNLHTDGWFRSLNYGAPEITAGRHSHRDYTKGGFAGKELWYGGSIGGRLHKG
jgi:hypothetical protein